VVPVAARFDTNSWAYMSPTYDNGDKSDNWCGSHTKVVQEMIGPEYYDAPKCGIRNYFGIGQTKIENLPWTNDFDNAICM